MPKPQSIRKDSPKTSKELRFVVSTKSDKHNPELRKVIRSHVMLGKNAGRTLPPRKKKAREALKQPNPANSRTSASRNTSTSADSPGSGISDSTVPTPILTLTPTNLRSGLSTIRLADDLEPGAIDSVIHMSSIAKQLLFPLEPCMFFDRRAENWIAPLAHDPAYLHTMIFSSQLLSEALAPGAPSSMRRRSLPHYLKAVRLLSDRIAYTRDVARLSDSTVAAVMILTTHAHMVGDLQSARHHMKGLFQIVSLRGGMSSFERNVKLLIEILRHDLRISLYDGSSPLFFTDSLPPYPDLSALLAMVQPLIGMRKFTLPNFLDAELRHIWSVMTDFSMIVNHAVDAQLRITTDTFLATMASVAYRLLKMHFEQCSCNEVVRLALLAFVCKTFLQWTHFGISYPHLVSLIKNCYSGLNDQKLPPELTFWALMIIAVFGLNEPALKSSKSLLWDSVQACGIQDWTEARLVLDQFVWIGLVFDRPGKIVFEEASSLLDERSCDISRGLCRPRGDGIRFARASNPEEQGLGE